MTKKLKSNNDTLYGYTISKYKRGSYMEAQHKILVKKITHKGKRTM